MGNDETVTKAIWVFQFHPIRDWLTQDEGSADDDSLISDDEDEMYEGSGFGGVNVGVQLVEDSDFVLTEYGPGAVEACALSLQQTRRNVVFVVTGGKNARGVTMDKVMRLQLDSNNGREPTLGTHRDLLPPLRTARRRHGCTKVTTTPSHGLIDCQHVVTSKNFSFQTDIDGDEVIVVAGGLDARDSPAKEVEFLNVKENIKWKTLGRLNNPVRDFPTVGRVLGHLTVVGGGGREASDGDPYNIDNTQTTVISTEVYDEAKSLFRPSLPSDDLNIFPVRSVDYQYYGVLFPKHWCRTY